MNTFANVVGHQEIVAHLQNAIRMNKISHAYIFSGEDGIGKNFIANIFAATIQCEKQSDEPCQVCKSCHQAESMNQPDIKYITHEKASIGVDDIRTQLNNDIDIKPYSSRYKIYIVDEAEKMTEQAQNALLKTIEEPPEYAVILLLTNQKNLFLPTILSRCVTLDFKTISKNEIMTYLMVHEKIPDYQAEIASTFACGNLGKALKYATSEQFVQIKSQVIHLMKHISETGISQIGQAVRYFTENKAQINDCLDLMYLWFRDVLMFKATKDINLLLYKEEIQAIKEQSNTMSFEKLNTVIDSFSTVKTRLNANVNFDIAMELLLLSMSQNEDIGDKKGEK